MCIVLILDTQPVDPAEWTTPTKRKYTVSVSPFVACVEAAEDEREASTTPCNTNRGAMVQDKHSKRDGASDSSKGESVLGTP